MNSTMALFDLDGTLCRGHIWEGFCRYYTKYKKKKILQTWAFLTTHSALWLLVKCRLFSKERCWVKWGEDLSGTFKEAGEEEVLEIFRWVVDNYVIALLRDDVIDIMNWHKQSGHLVVIISASFSPLLEIIGQRLGVSNVIGTKLEMIDDTYTGKIVKPLCFGENKAKLLKDFVNQNGLEVDLPSSFAYADSIFDIPLLKLVGHPVATYPDRDLCQLAERSGWRILS